jgi:hypothetical protein
VVDGGRDVALRGRERLAVVERLELGKLGAVRLDQLRERVHQARPLRRVDLAKRPVQHGARGGGGPGRVLGSGERDLADHVPGRRIDRLERVSLGGLDVLAADQKQPRARVDELAGGR